MTKFKIIPIFVVVLSLIFLGCIDQKQTGTPTPTVMVTPTATPTAVPTVVATTPQPTPTPVRAQVLYISEVDDVYGFRKVIVRNGSSNYTNHTLTINAGDIVEWKSVTDNNYSITIVSQEGLWNNSSSRLRYVLSRFDYTFTQPGNYEVYLKEFPKPAHQRIIVNP